MNRGAAASIARRASLSRAAGAGRERRASLPSAYLPLAGLAVALSAAGWFDPARDTNIFLTYISASIVFFFMVNDGYLVLRGAGTIGRFLLTLGVFYWFWVEALSMALSDPAFPLADPVYPYFGYFIPDDIVATGILALNIFTLAMLWGWSYLKLPRRFVAALSSRRDPPSTGFFDVVVFAVACLYWVPILLEFQGSITATANALLAMRSLTEVERVDVGIISHLRWFGLFGGALGLARVLTMRPGIRLLQIAAVGIVLPGAFLSSSRYTMGYVALPAIIMLLARVQGAGGWRRRRFLVAVAAASLALILLVQGAVRTSGLRSYVLDSELSTEQIIAESFKAGFIGHEHFTAMSMAIGIVPRHHDYFMEPVAPYFVFHFIPRPWWPDKPISESWLFYNDTVTQGRAFNVTPSVVGQYYMNWGFPGVLLIGLVLGWFARIGEYWFNLLDLRRQMLSATVCGLWLVFIFLSFRIVSPLYFQYVAFGFIAYRLLSRRMPPGLRRGPV